VQFLDCNQKTSQENCNECIAALNHFFKVLSYEESIKTQQTSASNNLSKEKDSKSSKATLFTNSYATENLSMINQKQSLSAQSSSTNTTNVTGRSSSSRYGGSEKSLSTNSNNATNSNFNRISEEKIENEISLKDLTKVNQFLLKNGIQN